MEVCKFEGTDQKVLTFVNAKNFDYETDYGNASVNVKLFGSHGKSNVPLGYNFIKDSAGHLSIVTDEILNSLLKVSN